MSSKNGHLYRFGAFRLNSSERILYHAETAVPLKPKAVETLIVLAENAGSVVSKADLMNQIWGETFVEENNLSVNIYELRKAFARFDRDEKYIETVPRRGFRFNPTVEKISLDDEAAAKTKSNGAANPSRENSPRRVVETSAENFTPPPENRRTNLPRRFVLHRQSLLALLAVMLIVGIGGGWLYARRHQTRLIEPANQEQRRSKQRGTESIEAFQLYLRGRELWQTRNNLKMAEGIEFFRRAIELDPNFAQPYLGIADSFSMMRNDAEDWRQAEVYANKALELQPDSADAHATLGFIYAMNKWQWRAAETYFQKALALDENSGKAHQWYATLLLIERRFTEAEAHLRRAIEIEPMSPNYNNDLCGLYLLTKRDEEMFAQCRRANEINPDYQYAFYEREIYERQKRYDEAAEAWIKAYARFGVAEADVRRADWYQAYLKNGYRGWIFSDIEGNKKSADRLLGVWNNSVAYAKLGDREKTLENLEKAFAGRTFLLPFANVNPEFDFLRDDAQFQDLMRRVGLR